MRMLDLFISVALLGSLAASAGQPTYYLSKVKKNQVDTFFLRLANDEYQFVVTPAPVANALASVKVSGNGSIYVIEGANGGNCIDGFSNPSDNQKIVRDRTSVGVGIGHSFDTFYVRLGVYGYSKWTDTFNTVVTNYTNGYGLQLDFGVPIMIGSSFYFAPQFTIQTFQYQSSESSGSTSALNPPMTDTVLSPYLVFGFMI